MQLTFQSIKSDNIHLLQAKQLIKPNFPYVCCFSSLLCVIFIPHTLKFPWKSLYEKTLSTVFESKHLIQFMLNEMYTKGFGLLKKLIKCAFSQHVVRRLSCNFNTGDFRPTFFYAEKSPFLCQQSCVCTQRKKILRSQESTCVFSIKYLM